MDRINTEVFLKAAETLNFRRTADELGYTQAGVSYIISSMEQELGLPLFIREYGGVELTAEGRDLLPWIRDLAASEHRLRERVDDLKNLDAGEIRVLVFYSISLRWIPGILERFHRDYPNIRVQLVSVDETGLAQEMTRRREVDCGFYILPVADDLEMIPVMDEPMKASFAPDHPAAAMDHFPVADLDRYPYINLVRDTEVMDLFRKYGKTPKIGFTSENDLSALAMASKGLGYCINSSILLEDIPYDLVSVEFDEPVRRTICIGARKISESPKAARMFIRYAREWLAERYGIHPDAPPLEDAAYSREV
ncbi:MAG: LysR family transcriptional regulator [Lachnospiraceae bacterium]|nr:LysR family transcriptional regulator [Lachnospiraceae bacterium]